MNEKLIWHQEKRKVADLIPASYNPRQISELERKDLMASITEFGLVVPIVINLDNKMIGGHQRLGIYADLQIEEVDVQVPNRQLTLEEEMRLNLRLNKNTGSWDVGKLSEMNVNTLLDVGFADDELSKMWDKLDLEEDNHDDKKAIEKAKETKIKIGEIYQLGEHRLMCGDSLDVDDVKKLMGGVKTTMIYCDPPYNIGLNYQSGIGGNKEYSDSELDDNKIPADYKIFLEKTIQNALLNADKNCHIFYWCDEKYIGMVQNIYEDNRIENKRVCLWIKNNQNPTPQIAFNKVYEPCVYGVIGKPFLNKNYQAFNEVMNKEVGTGNQLIDDVIDLYNIWLVRREASADYEHPTQKPVRLHEKALKRCSGPGSVVLDLFGGSGSTLMACEQLKRKAFLIEMNPIFCQVIIDRWEKYTRLTAQKVV